MSPIWNNSSFLRLDAWTINDFNTSNTWTVPKCNPEKVLVFKAARVGLTNRVDESGEQVGWTSRGHWD